MEEGTLSVRKIVIAGVLSAIAILLGWTRLGFIPVPTAAGNATIMHVPAIVGGVLEGGVVGGIVGTIFGFFSFLQATVPMFKDPLVAVLPRIFIGVLCLARLRRPEAGQRVPRPGGCRCGGYANQHRRCVDHGCAARLHGAWRGLDCGPDPRSARGHRGGHPDRGHRSRLEATRNRARRGQDVGYSPMNDWNDSLQGDYLWSNVNFFVHCQSSERVV